MLVRPRFRLLPLALRLRRPLLPLLVLRHALVVIARRADAVRLFQQLRLQRLYDVAAQRLTAIDRDPSGETVPFSEILGDEGYNAFLALDPDDLSDGELFA